MKKFTCPSDACLRPESLENNTDALRERERVEGGGERERERVRQCVSF